MMDIKTYLYNTLTKQVDEFVPNEPGKVAMYTCGPTVYHYAHIGNLRSYIMEDVLEKYLRFVGYDVKRVMNITDVGHLTSDGDTGEDKMLKGAKREHKTVMDIARFYTDAFMADCEKLSIKKPDVVEPATNCIPEFIHMIENRQCVIISAPEEIAFRFGWINKEQLIASAEKYGKSPYGAHLKSVAYGKIFHS